MNESFDWIRARASCSVRYVFNEIEHGVLGDVDAINSQRQSEDQAKVSLRRVSNGHFSVILETAGHPPRSVDFAINEQAITATDGRDVNLSATLTLNDDGHCRLKVEGKELEQWQFRRMALEDLFFGSTVARSVTSSSA